MDSTPSKSLTDEIMDMVDDYAARSVRVGRPIPESKRFYTAIRSRLQSLETELTELRGMKETLIGWANMQPPERTNALPCSSPIELVDETGG